MKREKAMIQEKLIIEDKMKIYTFITYYDKDESYRLTQCVAKTIEEAEHIFADLINLPYIKISGKKDWHLGIEKKWWEPLKVNKYKDIWAVDFIVRNNFVMSFVKISEILDIFQILDLNMKPFHYLLLLFSILADSSCLSASRVLGL